MRGVAGHCIVGMPAGRLRQRLIAPRTARADGKAKNRRVLTRQQASFSEERQKNQTLSDLITFETEGADGKPSPAQRQRSEPEGGQKRTRSEPEAGNDVIQSATAALEAAREALKRTQAQEPSRPDPSRIFTSQQAKLDAEREGNDDTRTKLGAALDRYGDSGGSTDQRPPQSGGPGPSDASRDQGRSASGPDRQQSQEPRLQPAAAAETREAPLVADRVFSQLSLQLESAAEAERAKTATLPPLQSVVDLTSAAAPPTRSMEQAATSISAAGRQLEDGAGQLADGTRFERTTSEEFGPDGYWLRQTVMRGVSAKGEVEWEERWWEASDWAGMREMGAEKSGCATDGSAWRETWREAIAFDSASGEPIVERSAHKWAQDAVGDSWEEKWGEHYAASGAATKYADKWGKDGPNVWHERWGEDYNGDGGCVKYTDKWAERLLEGGANEQWGENWVEDFGSGAGSKKGETWTVDGGGERYQRWWGEDHFGNGWVRRHGSSTTGEHWDNSEQMDTYYNPVPHFTYKMALDHSPTLQQVPVLPRGNLEGDLEDGAAADL